MGKIDMTLYIKHLRTRYRRGDRATKSKILDDFCEAHGYHRKHATRLLGTYKDPYYQKKRGRKKSYEPGDLLEPLKRIWLATDQMCSKRLKEAIPLWLPYYEKEHGKLLAEIQDGLKSMSPSTIDRLLKPLRSNHRRRLNGTKPGSILKQQIPIKTEQWNTTKPGYVEADTVAHCGASLSGEFVWSLTLTDIHTGWTEMRAVWGKGSAGVLEKIKCIEQHLPFKLLGFDCDNGSEFLNYHLIRYFQEHHNKIDFTRSRPYRKDDNAHVEQKNWTHVRQIFGYSRFDNFKLVHLIDDVYKNEISALYNFFHPCLKLQSKEREGGKLKKYYDKAATPYERVLASPDVDADSKEKLKHQFDKLNPFDLQKTIQKKLRRIFTLVKVEGNKNRVAI